MNDSAALQSWNRILVTFLAMYILVSPGASQLLRIDFPMIRPWQMYTTVGAGAPYGTFRIMTGGQNIEEIAVTEALEIKHIRDLQPYPGSGDIERSFLGRAALIEAAQGLCRELTQGQRLEFEGRVAGRHGWQSVALDHAQLCPES